MKCVVPVDDVVLQVILEKRRLFVAADLADRSDIRGPISHSLLEPHRNTAVLDIADIAVVQRVEMRDVEKVFDQQERVCGHRHRPGIRCLPRRVGDLR
jgi:hypothetical protein